MGEGLKCKGILVGFLWSNMAVSDTEGGNLFVGVFWSNGELLGIC